MYYSVHYSKFWKFKAVKDKYLYNTHESIKRGLLELDFAETLKSAKQFFSTMSLLINF